MSTLMRKQGGWTFFGLMAVLVVAGIFAMVAFKLAPIYQDHKTLQSILEDVAVDRHLLSEKKQEIKSKLSNRYRMNSMYDFPQDAVTIVKDKGDVKLVVKYERRVPIFANVDAVVYFEELYEGRELD